MAEPTRILVLPDGRAVLVRTPLGRSLRFASLADAEAYHSGQMAGIAPLMVVGVGLGVAKRLVSEAVFLPLVAVGLVGGVVAGGVVGTLARRNEPPYETLTWSESVALDDREVNAAAIGKDVGLSLLSGAMLGLFLFFFRENHWRLEGDSALVPFVAGAFFLGLVVGVGAGIAMAVQKLRFIAERRRTPR
jgi:hypothetical protein